MSSSTTKRDELTQTDLQGLYIGPFRLLTDKGPEADNFIKGFEKHVESKFDPQPWSFVKAVSDCINNYNKNPNNSEINEEIKEIIDTYIRAGSEKEVNLSEQFRQITLKAFNLQEAENKTSGTMNPGIIFNTAFTEIARVMKTNEGPAFNPKYNYIMPVLKPAFELVKNLEKFIDSLPKPAKPPSGLAERAKKFISDRSNPGATLLEALREDAIKMVTELNALIKEIQKNLEKLKNDPNLVKKFQNKYEQICRNHYQHQMKAMNKLNKPAQENEVVATNLLQVGNMIRLIEDNASFVKKPAESKQKSAQVVTAKESQEEEHKTYKGPGS